MKKKAQFKLHSKFTPAGDQPQAIQQITENFNNHLNHQTLLGVTGSGKTYTMANIIQNLNVPTLILAPNKTLAAQLYVEFKEFFPENAVEYFVSYYDYYQPEAYLPATDTFIEKDSSINEQIDRMRHSATRSLFERRDVVIVSSVSCIYGLGSPEQYGNLMIDLKANSKLKRDTLLRSLVGIQYVRSDVDFHRGTFRVRGDIVEIHPTYEEDLVIRVEFFGDYIERISWLDPVRGTVVRDVEEVSIFPGSHHVTSQENIKAAIGGIQDELRDRIQHFKTNMQYLEAERIEKRTYHDIEILEEMGFCPGIENYSRFLTGRPPGMAPPTLLEYFPADFLTIIDESHVTVPQIGGMYRGDRARKMTLVEHGFRLPSALDNRPLNFDEFEKFTRKTLYVSATPKEFEIERSQGLIVEQIIRPTGLLDPEVFVKPAKHQLDDLLVEIQMRTKQKERVLVTTLTKKSAEDLTDFLTKKNMKVKYLHSDVHTIERTEIIRDLRLGVFDVLVGINLLREGLDIPEVSLVAILDADKEGFLRSERSLIQTIGRAARNAQGKVILYADGVTDSMARAMKETSRRRQIQEEYNKGHGITPQTVFKKVNAGMLELYDPRLKDDEGLREVSQKAKEYEKSPSLISKDILALKNKMKSLSQDLEFEEAAKVRDEIKRLQILELEIRGEE
ncbi:MAG: excinuclease ABC subunit UvrB [Bdellovibrionaceae bacterium]|nr:excinuclease ABC subunit UvrB [Pseudobdellovibrionaceae bacterium]